MDENGHRAGQVGWTQGPPSTQGAGLRTWSGGHHRHGRHWRGVVYVPPILLLALLCVITSGEHKSSNQSLGLRVLGGWEL